MHDQKNLFQAGSASAPGSTEAMPPTPTDEQAPDFVDHGDGTHSHKHGHDTPDAHYHRHHHPGGDRAHAHLADHPIHAEHPDHRRQHVGG